jgi:hypothetical protein
LITVSVSVMGRCTSMPICSCRSTTAAWGICCVERAMTSSCNGEVIVQSYGELR